MAKLQLPPGMTPKPTAAGTRFYWQPTPRQRKAGWKGLALGDDPIAAIRAAEKRNAEVEEWAAGGARPAAVKKILRGGTIGFLFDSFERDGFPSVKRPGTFLEPATVKEYRSKMRLLRRAWPADAPLSVITPARVAVLRDALMQPAKSGRRAGEVRHTTAHAALRVGRALWTYGEQKGLVPRGQNPFENFGLGMPAPRDQIWSPEAREALIGSATGQPSMQLAVEIAFQTGQREADLLKLLHSQWVAIPRHKMDMDVWETLAGVPVPPLGNRPGYDPGNVYGIRLRQSKGRRWVEVPVVGTTRARVEAEIAHAKALGLATILFDEESGRPWTLPNPETGQTRFIRRFADLRAAAIAGAAMAGAADLAAEMADLQYRDFRRTAVVHLGELGLPDHLIAAITGHTLDETKRIVETYMPRTTAMAARAIALSHARGQSPGIGDAGRGEERAG